MSNALFTTILLALGLTAFCMGLVIWAQVLGTNPLSLHIGRRPLHTPMRPGVNWESPLEVALVVFMTIPPLTLLRGIGIAFSEVQWLVDGGFFLLGLLLFVLSMENMDVCLRYMGSEMWPTTWAKIYTIPTRNKYTYMYTVGDHQYKVETISAPHRPWQPLIQRRTRSHAKLEEVLVYYHPENPALALLIPGVNWSSVSVFMGLSISFLLTPALFLILV